MLIDELRSTFLFEKLSDDQLHALMALGEELTFPANELLCREGQPADYLWVLLDGEVELSRQVGAQRIVVEVMNRPGTYAGGVAAFASSETGKGYRASGRTLRPTRFFRLASTDLSRLLDEWLPMAKHLLDGYIHTFEYIEIKVRQHSHLISLGTLSAGLMHELNNPVAATRGAATDLRATLLRLQSLVGRLATGELTPAQIKTMHDLTGDAATRSASAPRRGTVATGRLEASIGDWLQDHEVANPWDIAATFVAAGLDVPWLNAASQALGSAGLSVALNWIAGTLLATSLLDQVDDATRRISDLVAAVKDYSSVDRAPEREVDIHEGIDKTLVMLGNKLRSGVEVTRDCDEHLPRIIANESELNQVWTNLIDNAIDAMDGHGQLRIRTSHDKHAILVEIADQGPGIPPQIATRIFDPFFTTKDVGKGTGLGLDIVRRIVVDRYHGDVTFESVSADTEPASHGTRFVVRLPLTAHR